MNKNVINNYSKLKPSLFYLPAFLLVALVLFLCAQDALSGDKYIQIQKDSFFFMNDQLGQYPNIQYNLTQLGDEEIFLSFLSIFIIYAPEIWESLISVSLVTVIFSSGLKKIFHVPRPAEVFDENSFVIVGKTLHGHNSLPSGHSITVFAILTVLLFAFMPQQLKYKILWSFFILVMGLILVFTRVGVGAHYPLDVILGSVIGYISGLIGIFINQRYKIWTWVSIKKYYPIFILLILIAGITLINKIVNENLIIFYLALFSLFVPFYKMMYALAKK